MKGERNMNIEMLKLKKLMLVNMMMENGYNKQIDNELLNTVKAIKEGGVK